jgi:hypothetical protein
MTQMTPLTDPLVTSFNDLSVNDLTVRLRQAADKAEIHEAFQGQLSEYVSTAVMLREIADEIEKARDAALTRDTLKVAILNALVEKGKRALIFNARHIVMLSIHRDDPSLLENTSYDLKKKSLAKAKVSLLSLMPEVYVKHGSVTETLDVLVKRAKKDATIELQLTDQDPNLEESWNGKSLGIYNRSRIDVKDQKAARKVYLRARYHVEGGVGPWSAPVSIVVI